MKCGILKNGVLVFVLAGFLAAPLSAQDDMSNTANPASQEEMMARWQAAMTPGDAHKKLESFVGTWDVKSQMWPNGPDGPPTESQGTATYKMIFGGRFLEEEFSGDMMQQPLTGVGFTGYDNMKQKYVGVWLDNMGTAVSTMEGVMDGDGKTLTMTGKMDEPMTGEKNKDVKYVMRLVDPDTHVFEMYDPSMGGGNKPAMRLTYTRKK